MVTPTRNQAQVDRLYNVVLVAVLLVSASTWIYVNRILIPQQIADAEVRHQPRGSFSDLYPRWLGARELLRHGRNPYGADVTREIQQGYYGRALDPANPNDPKDQQGFAYPVYVVFLLSPTVGLPFDVVQDGFRVLLVLLAVADVFLWLRVLQWRLATKWKIALIVLMLGWLPMVQGVKLQQLTLLVTALLAACGACLAAGWLALAGVLLALATIKPQLTGPLAVWLVVWALSEWKTRWRFLAGFAGSMAVLLCGAQILLPGWWAMFLQAVREYRVYTHGEALLVFLFGGVAGRVLQIISLLVCAAIVWRWRKEQASSHEFGTSMALILALTLVLLPITALYNQVLLAPAILALLQRQEPKGAARRMIHLLRLVCWMVLIWPWLATFGLSCAYPWMTPDARQKLYSTPFLTSLTLPLVVLGLAALQLWRYQARGLRENAGAE